ncbi:Ig-like domain repeat protein [Cellulomonas gilvus]|uniref:Bacterial Ig-like domain-containing protein n=1 Tax=Cellulomonas gilvus (strain ATCC 13127 / NRRL B-14078) TaxID=593907 RepID=F8A254_CELGA|nr:Ig-like domain repeat protein [Cellulomonas gilvus]AEI10574.1 hypothetical protein Celgi_0040 [Cellulomonas gilvus ATCC 13127]
MKVSTFGRIGLTAGVVALVVGTVGTPALADPPAGTFGTLAGLGSDTTQDVVGGLATAIGGGVLASYDATGSATVTTRSGGTAVPRANNSGGGRDLLRVAIGQTETASIPVFGSTPSTVTTAQLAGQVQFARSSSGPSSSDVTPEGVLTYVPFAIDAVSYATAPDSVIPANLTKAQLVSIYKGEYTQVVVNGGATSLQGPSYVPVPGDTVTAITSFLPAAGSGTRSYWLGQMGITEQQIADGTYPNLKAVDFAGAGVQEHKGAALVSGTVAQNAGAIAPFSIAQWVAQGNAKVTDHRAGVHINGVNGVVPTTGDEAAHTLALNPAFNAYTRPVYNVVPSVLADDPTSQVARTFVGTGSLVCQETATITAYGFGLLSGSVSCGDTTTRAYRPSTSQTSVTLASATAVAGSPVGVDVAVTSVGDGGGTVRLYSATDTLLGSVAVPAGAATASGTFTPTSAGALAVRGVFVPRLAGVAASESPAQQLTVTAPAVSSTTRVTVSSPRVVGRAFTATATVTATKPVPGTVTFFDGTTKLGTVSIASGKTTAALAIKATKTAYALKAVYAPAGAATVKGSTSAVVKVAVAKATAKLAVTAPTSIAKGKAATVKVTVTATGVSPTGKVTVKEGAKVLGTATLKAGKATLTVKGLKVGSHKLVVTYAGSATVAKASVTKTVKVV